MKEEKKNINKTTDTEPPLKKKKQSIACDNCRKTKQRCDGNSPCIRCQNKNKTCAYSPTSLRGKRKFSDLDIVKIENNSIISTNYNIMTSSIERKYLDAYFSYMKPPMLFQGINYDSLLNLQGNDGKSLQFNIAIATAARSFGDSAVSSSFEKKARHLAAELFDQFTLDTARGFSMLSYHYSGQDNYLSQHYRDLTLSICKRLQAMYSSSSDTSIKSEIFMTKFSACSLSMYDTNAISPFTQLNEEQGLVDIGQLSYLLRKIPRVYDIINKCYNPNNFPCIRKGSLTSEEAEFYLDRLNENFSDHCILRELPEPAKFCCSHILVLKGLVCFCSGQLDKSIEYVTEVVTFFADQKDFVRFCPPFFIHTFHILFSLCYQLGKYELANIVTSLQRYISEILPLGKPLLEANIETLNSMHTINSMNQAFPIQIPQNTTNIISDVSQFNFFEEFLNDNGDLSFSSDSQGDDFETSFQSILLDPNFKTSGFDHPQFKSSNSTFDNTFRTIQYDPTFKPNTTESISQIVGYDTPLKSSYDNFEPLTKSGNSKLFHPNTDFNLVKPVEFDFFNSSPSLY